MDVDKLMGMRVDHLSTNADGHTVIHFEGGETLTLDGGTARIDVANVPRCSFCGAPADKATPLYTVNGKVYICRGCLIEGFETLLANGVDMPLHCVTLGKLVNNEVVCKDGDAR